MLLRLKIFASSFYRVRLFSLTRLEVALYHEQPISINRQLTRPLVDIQETVQGCRQAIMPTVLLDVRNHQNVHRG
jgi:hypothetical protein